MYTLMGGGLLCAVSGLILLIVATATDFWMQYRYSGNLSNQGLWRFCMSGKCHPHTISIGATLRVISRMQLMQNAATRFLPAFWDATRAFMLLSILSCFAGIILGLTAFSSSARASRTRSAGITLLIAGLFALLGLSVYTGVTVNFFGKRYADWRFSWSYILGWIAVILTLSAGIFHVCAVSKSPSPENSNAASG
ncbi:lens fiber membrane intrinsic protein-like [Caretta caretta]|uniref:lens fiber membrane intrinsic protein n=1 Tax=Chelonia mydas TaxID=8469 RepID=UPI0018A222D7|nr:lens fiber membrane intrinsic protein [Chelonia mydas]XP_048683738.1 lens fiber membrane intrinsic protein-like [Caretta caretta]